MYTGSARNPLPRRFAALLAFSFAANWVWEVAQMAAYEPAQGRTRGEEFLICTLAAVGDALLTLLVFAAVEIVKRRRRWAGNGGLKAYGLAALAGAALAVAVEWAALGFGYWSYARAMPRLPLLGVGLLPLAQLTLLVPFSMLAAGRIWRALFSGNGSHA